MVFSELMNLTQIKIYLMRTKLFQYQKWRWKISNSNYKSNLKFQNGMNRYIALHFFCNLPIAACYAMAMQRSFQWPIEGFKTTNNCVKQNHNCTTLQHSQFNFCCFTLRRRDKRWECESKNVCQHQHRRRGVCEGKNVCFWNSCSTQWLLKFEIATTRGSALD